jgi:hypothetical protein
MIASNSDALDIPAMIGLYKFLASNLLELLAHP